MKEVIPEILFSIETSAKENTNIDALFANLARELKERTDSLSADGDDSRIKLGDGRSLPSKLQRCTGMCNNESASKS